MAVLLFVATALLGTLYIVYTRVIPGLVQPEDGDGETTSVRPLSP